MEIIIKAAQNELQAETIKANLEKIVEGLQKKLNLNQESLEYLIVPSDFFNDLTEFQRSHNLPEEYTNSNGFIAAGKTLKYQSGDRFNTTIFIHPGIIQCLYIDDRFDEALNIVCHELCHVHDMTNRQKILSPKFYHRMWPPSLTFLLQRYSNLVWEEYYACRLSSFILQYMEPTKIDENILYLDAFFNELSKIQGEIQKAIRNHARDADINDLINNLVGRILSFLQNVGRLLGHMEGVSDSTLIKKVNGQIECSFFGEVWNEVRDELRKLFDMYPDWAGEEAYESLSNMILEGFYLFGIFPTNFVDDDGKDNVWWNLQDWDMTHEF